MSDKVVFLTFNNPNVQADARDLIACTLCRNKAFSLVYQGADRFPQLQCTACEQYVGAIGWADEQGASA